MSPVQAVVPMTDPFTPAAAAAAALHRADWNALFSPCEVCIAGS